MFRTICSRLCVIAIVLFSTALVQADAYVAVNPATGTAEAVWTDQGEGQTSADVLHATFTGSSWSASTVVSSAGKEASSAVLVFDEGGGTKVAWESASDEIYLSIRADLDGSWSDGILMSENAEAGTAPSAAAHGSDVVVSYEAITETGARLVKVSKGDPGGSVERTLVASTSRTDPLVTKVHSEGGYLWVDWIDSDSALGYSTCVDGVWEEARSEPYDGSVDLDPGRERIRARVLSGN